MTFNNIENMKLGWFVGDFEPSIFQSKDVEVALKKYKKGDYESAHYHKIATEITLLVSGSAQMGDKQLHGGDMIRLEPGEHSDFRALTDCITVVVKMPSAPGDKYPSI